ncbi:MAG: hypothetical protein WC607_00625 [Candidatus Micrarchaeia archaeon]
MAFLDLFGKKPASDASAGVYAVDYRVHPLRLRAHSPDYAKLDLTVTNVQAHEALTSVVFMVPKGLGFEQSCLSQQREIRLGPMAPGERRKITLNIWAGQRTQPGLYPVALFALSHYLDYGHVLNESKHKFAIRVA